MTPPDAAWHDTWAEVDRTDDPKWFVRFLDSTREGLLAQVKANPMSVYGHLEPAPGKTVLDIGCGTGTLLHSLAELVAPDGEVFGVDFSATMIDEARARAAALQFPPKFEVMDAMNLDFEDGQFDATTATIVFEHVPEPDQAIAEAIRVTKPGGIVSAIDQDLDGTLIDADDLNSVRAVVRHFSDSVKHGRLGRQLYAKFARAGMQDIRVMPVSMPMRGAAVRSSLPLLEEAIRRTVASGAITAQQGQDLQAELESRTADGTAFVFMSVFRVTARKPL